MQNWPDAVLILITAICVITDLRSRKIYNVVLFPALGLAVAGHIWTGGWGGAVESLAGFGAGLALLLIPYLLGGMGAGDVKLLAVIGSLQGAAFAFSTAVYMALLGFVMSLVVLGGQQKTRSFIKLVFYTLYAWKSGVLMPFPRRGEALTATMPYGVAIAGGALLVLFWKGVFPG